MRQVVVAISVGFLVCAWPCLAQQQSSTPLDGQTRDEAPSERYPIHFPVAPAPTERPKPIDIPPPPPPEPVKVARHHHGAPVAAARFNTKEPVSNLSFGRPNAPTDDYSVLIRLFGGAGLENSWGSAGFGLSVNREYGPVFVGLDGDFEAGRFGTANAYGTLAGAMMGNLGLRLGDLRPFVGAGLALSQIRITGFPSAQRLGFALQGGFRFPISQGIDLTTVYRRVDYGQVGRNNMLYADRVELGLSISLQHSLFPWNQH